jgi:inosine-uridine nucleoside N-ribohydrolase
MTRIGDEAEPPQPTIMNELPEMNHHRRPILIDTDTASDDAVALIIALRCRASKSKRSPPLPATLTRGMTVVDRLDVAADPRNSAVWSEVMRRSEKAEVCWRIDVRGWKAELITALKPANKDVPEQKR